MTAYRWSAVNPGGEVVSGVTDAPDRETVVERLQHQGQIVMRAEPVGARWELPEFLRYQRGRRALGRAALTEVTRELAIMLAAGQDLDRALRFVVDNVEAAPTRAILEEVRDKVRGGSSLAASLASQPRSFSRLYVGMVRAGEAGGSLPEAIERLAVLLERDLSLRAGLLAALTYPAVLVVASVASIMLLLGYVLPQFEPLFEQASAELPLSTRILIASGHIAGAAGPWLLIAGLAALLIGRRALASAATRLRAERALLRAPIAGKLIREIAAGRLMRTLGTLLQNGMPLIPALGIARDAIGNAAIGAALDDAATQTKSGRGLARPLEESGLLPPRAIHLLQLGEETGQLGAMALKAADIHDEQARLMLQRLVALLVPTITIIMGLTVAGIVVALLSAMLRLSDLVV